MGFDELPPQEDSPESFLIQPNLEWGNLFGGDAKGNNLLAEANITLSAPGAEAAAGADGGSPAPAPQTPAPQTPGAPPALGDYLEHIRPLFCDIARHHCETLPALMAEVQRGEAPEETFHALLGIFEKLLASAREVEISDLAHDLEAVLERLTEMAEQSAPSPLEIAELIRRYRELAKDFPEIFMAPESECADKFIAESIIIVEELRGIRGLGKMRSRYLFAAGINRLSIFCEASLRDLEAVSGMNSALAERITASFEPYKSVVRGDPNAMAQLRQKAAKDLAFHLMDLEECDRELEQVHERNRFKIVDISPEEAQLQRIRQRYYGAVCKNLAILGRLRDIETLATKRFRERIQSLWAILEEVEAAL